MALKFENWLPHKHFHTKYQYLPFIFKHCFQLSSPVQETSPNQQELIIWGLKHPFPSKTQNRQVSWTSPKLNRTIPIQLNCSLFDGDPGIALSQHGMKNPLLPTDRCLTGISRSCMIRTEYTTPRWPARWSEAIIVTLKRACHEANRIWKTAEEENDIDYKYVTSAVHLRSTFS